MGSTTPVMGSIFSAAPTLVMTWMMIHVPVPAASKRVKRSGFLRQPQDRVHQHREQRQDRDGSDESQLFADHREDEVGVGRREAPHFSREPPIPVPNQPPVPRA